jgi:hypothetical protein
MRNDEVCCPFCGKREDEVAQMIDRAHAFICDHCIDICHEPSAKSASGARRPDPSARGSADRKNSAKQPCGRTVLCHRGFEQVIGYLQSAICNTKVGVEKGELLGSAILAIATSGRKILDRDLVLIPLTSRVRRGQRRLVPEGDR